MSKSKSTPAIRFAGFTDAWEQRKLKDTFDLMQNNTLSRADLSLDSGVAKNIHYGDVLIKFGEYLDATKTALPFITSQQIAEKYKSSILQDGDIIMADTAEDETVGKCTEIVNLQGFPAISGLHTIPLRPKDNFATGFLGYYMNSEAYHNQLLPLMQGIKVTSISKGALQDTVISFPSDVAEQAAIGQHFIYLDSLITLHQRKYDKLVKVKKAMLEKMFPKGGAKVPEIRFAGFTDAWERRKLGDIGSVAMCRRIFKHQTSESGEIPFFKIGTFGGEPDAFISRELFEEFKAKFPYPEKGDILISASGSIGRTVEFTGDNVYFQDSNIVWLKHDKSIINPFLRHLYSVVEWAGIEGSTIKRLYNDNILKTEVMLPSVQEQTKIAETLDGIDGLITLHQRKLEKLKTIKKSMLESMFV